MRYPDFRGDEPCAQLGHDLYQGDAYTPESLAVMRDCCAACHMLAECRAWSLHHEGHANGFWAGMTGEERRRERRRLNIVLVDPMVVFHASA